MIVIVATDDKYSSDKLSFCIPARIWLWHDNYHHQQVNIRIEYKKAVLAVVTRIAYWRCYNVLLDKEV